MGDSDGLDQFVGKLSLEAADAELETQAASGSPKESKVSRSWRTKAFWRPVRKRVTSFVVEGSDGQAMLSSETALRCLTDHWSNIFAAKPVSQQAGRSLLGCLTFTA